MSKHDLVVDVREWDALHAQNAQLARHIAAMADWLDIAADVIGQDRGAVLVVGEALKAAYAGRSLILADPGPTAAGARAAALAVVEGRAQDG